MLENEAQKLDISHPGKGKQLISPSQALEKKPDFFSSRPADVNWTLRVKHLDGTVEEMEPGTDWEAVSRFGSVRSAVATKPDGTPDFDRPRYDEAPNVNIVAWGEDKKTGEIRIGMISQAKPHADNDFEAGNTEPMVFEQIPMGFLGKLIGKDQIEKYESIAQGAKRETTEETGATAIQDISYPEYPKHYPNPTFIGTNSNLVFVKVDLEEIDKMKIDRKEQIFQAEYVPLNKLIDDIKQGKTDKGYARMCTSNSAILVFLSNLDSFRNAERNKKILSQEGNSNRQFKKEDSQGYIEHSLRRSKIKHPDRYEENKRKAEKHLVKQETLQKTKPESTSQVDFPKITTNKSLLDRIKFWKR